MRTTINSNREPRKGTRILTTNNLRYDTKKQKQTSQQEVQPCEAPKICD